MVKGLVLKRSTHFFGIEIEALKQRKRSKSLADARGVISYFAVREMGHNGAEVAKMFNVSRSGISIAADRGEEIVLKNPSIWKLV